MLIELCWNLRLGNIKKSCLFFDHFLSLFFPLAGGKNGDCQDPTVPLYMECKMKTWKLLDLQFLNTLAPPHLATSRSGFPF